MDDTRLPLTDHLSELRSRLLEPLALEKGALFWIPSILVAAALVLFGIRQAPSERTLFNHARDLRVALGPVDATGSSLEAVRAFETGLARGLRAQRELTLVDPARVRARLVAVLDGDVPPDPRSWMRGTRSLNVLYCLAAQLQADSQGWKARLDVWEVASEQRVHSLTASARGTEELGRALADSVSVALFTPQRSSQAAR